MFKKNGCTAIKKIFKESIKEKPPTIYIMEDVILKFKAYTELCDNEIGWLAFVNKYNGDYYIYDTILPEQEVTCVTTELTEQGLQKTSNEIISERPDEFNNVRCWCHSHVKMSVTPSGTDDTTFKQFYENCDYFIRIICNKLGDMRVDFIDLEKEVQFDNVDFKIYYNNTTAEVLKTINEIENEIKIKENELNNIKNIYHDVLNDELKKIKSSFEPIVKQKVKTYSFKTNNKYYSGYSNDDFYFNDNKKKAGKYETYEDIEEEDALIMNYTCWNKLSQAEKEEVCHLNTITILDSLKNEYTTTDRLLDEKTTVKMLEAATVSELKDLLSDKKFAKNYTEQDWWELLEEVDFFGITEIEVAV